MEAEVSLEAARYIMGPGLRAHGRISRREGYLVAEGDQYTIGELKGYGIDAYEVLPIDRWSGERWYKIVFSGTVEEIAQIEAMLMEKFPDVFEYNRSRPLPWSFR